MNLSLRIVHRSRLSAIRRTLQSGGSVSLFAALLIGCGTIQTTQIASVTAAPTITSQPNHLTVAYAKPATFSVTAQGKGILKYQWQKNLVNIVGATSSIYTLTSTTATDNGAMFNVLVSNTVGSITSNSAKLIVSSLTAPIITSQPQSQSATLGGPTTFAVTSSGSEPLSYQWQRNSMNIAGATSPSYAKPTTAKGDYGAAFNVVVSNAVGSVTSNAATLYLTPLGGASFFVATEGSDSADGSESNPFATLNRAQTAMRLSSIKTTQIKSGTYYLSSPLVLTERDQGETWEAIAGAKVVLSGGELLQGWTNDGSGVYSTKSARPVGLDLAISDVRQTPADRGYDPSRPYTTGWRMLDPNQTISYVKTVGVLPSDLTSSVKPGAIVQLLGGKRYSDNFTTILSVDKVNSTMTLGDFFYWGAGCCNVASASWRVLNDSADFSATGQFAYDSTTSKVYLKPENAETLTTDTVVGAQLNTLVSLTNVSGITISGLSFSATKSDWNAYSGALSDRLAAIMGIGLSYSNISGNTFLNVGNGISLNGSSGNEISNNSFDQLGGGGIFIVANSNRNSITRNTMTRLGKINAGSIGIHIQDSAFNMIDSNLIDGSGRFGIHLLQTDCTSLLGNVVSNNVIRNTGQQTNDVGAIYSSVLESGCDRYNIVNTTISGNRIENVGGLFRDSSGRYMSLIMAQGIYMDDHISGVTMTNNVIESASRGIFVCNGCQSNSADNNVVILQSAGLYDRGANGITLSTGDMTYNGTTHIDLLPSFFPSNVATSTIVVQLSGEAAGGIGAHFNVLADGQVIGGGTAESTVNDYVFHVVLTPHEIHQIGIVLDNGASSGTPTTALHNLSLFVNETPVTVSTRCSSGYTLAGFVANRDNLEPTNFSITHNIVYQSNGAVLEAQIYTTPGLLDPNPGAIDYNILFQNVTKAYDPAFGGVPLDKHTVVADPLFINPAVGDYRLRQNSPAPTAGFNSINVPLVTDDR